MYENRQKIKLLLLERILLENTDPEHHLSGADIIRMLGEYGINVERKSVYDDIDTLVESGLDITTEKRGHSNYYYVNTRLFQDEELTVLANIVSSSKFLTLSKSKELIRKFGKLTSIYQAQSLSRAIYVNRRPKSKNERIYYYVNTLNEAIRSGKQVSFRYIEYDISLKSRFRHGGQLYTVSPVELISDSDYYYLSAYSPHYNDISTYRIDRMDSVSISDLPKKALTAEEQEKAKLMRSTFGMFIREETTVTLEMANKSYVIGILIDKYGDDRIRPERISEDKFRVRIDAQISPAFWNWLFTFGADAKVVAPQWVVNEAKNMLADMSKLYEND